MDEENLNQIVDFFIKYHYYKNQDREEIKSYILKHWEYKTGFVILDKDEIVALARWNILPSGTVAEILDLIIRPDWRKYNRRLMQQMMYRGWWLFPAVKHIFFNRGKKYPNREPIIYDIQKFIRGGNNVGNDLE